jgi:hypothetical protein
MENTYVKPATDRLIKVKAIIDLPDGQYYVLSKIPRFSKTEYFLYNPKTNLFRLYVKEVSQIDDTVTFMPIPSQFTSVIALLNEESSVSVPSKSKQAKSKEKDNEVLTDDVYVSIKDSVIHLIQAPLLTEPTFALVLNNEPSPLKDSIPLLETIKLTDINHKIVEVVLLKLV